MVLSEGDPRGPAGTTNPDLYPESLRHTCGCIASLLSIKAFGRRCNWHRAPLICDLPENVVASLTADQLTAGISGVTKEAALAIRDRIVAVLIQRPA